LFSFLKQRHFFKIGIPSGKLKRGFSQGLIFLKTLFHSAALKQFFSESLTSQRNAIKVKAEKGDAFVHSFIVT